VLDYFIYLLKGSVNWNEERKEGKKKKRN